MPPYPEAMPHGRLREIFSDVFVVTGTSTPEFLGARWRYSRNMTVVRRGSSLTLVNSVRLSDQGLRELHGLGRIENVVRLGAFHGMDDAFYVHELGARAWAPPGMPSAPELTAPVMPLGPELPLDDASLFVFSSSRQPEAVLHLQRDQGVLIACDSLQNWLSPDEYFDAESAERMRALGFFRSGNVGPGWLMACQPRSEDFERLQQLPYAHLLSAHGEPLLELAKTNVAATLRELNLLPP